MLFFNLANAQVQLGDHARGIANYLRALEIEPENLKYRLNLLAARQLLSSDSVSWEDQVVAGISTKAIKIFAVVFWGLFWVIVALRLLRFAFPWKSLSLVCLMATFVAGGLYWLQMRSTYFPNHAVVVSDSVELRSGDGDSFPAVSSGFVSAGMIFSVVDRRGGWINLQLPDGATGWATEEAVELL